MRIAFILSLLLFTNLLFGQNNFANQLRQIINDTASHFQKFRGSIKEIPEILESETSYYHSTIVLEGTNENLVINHRSICSYTTDVADSVTKNKGKKILEEWKSKLFSVLGTGYTTEKTKLGLDDTFVEAWRFIRGNLSVSIYLSQYFYDRSFYRVTLSISNEHPTSKGL